MEGKQRLQMLKRGASGTSKAKNRNPFSGSLTLRKAQRRGKDSEMVGGGGRNKGEAALGNKEGENDNSFTKS